MPTTFVYLVPFNIGFLLINNYFIGQIIILQFHTFLYSALVRFFLKSLIGPIFLCSIVTVLVKLILDPQNIPFILAYTIYLQAISCCIPIYPYLLYNYTSVYFFIPSHLVKYFSILFFFLI